jgi:hypothetical protein
MCCEPGNKHRTQDVQETKLRLLESIVGNEGAYITLACSDLSKDKFTSCILARQFFLTFLGRGRSTSVSRGTVLRVQNHLSAGELDCLGGRRRLCRRRASDPVDGTRGASISGRAEKRFAAPGASWLSGRTRLAKQVVCELASKWVRPAERVSSAGVLVVDVSEVFG